VDELAETETAHTLEGPSFVWDGRVATWRRRHQWATLSASPETGPSFGHLLVLCRDPKIDGPFGVQSTPLPLFLEAERVETIATAIGQHFASPA
jgi:hypothetical protein